MGREARRAMACSALLAAVAGGATACNALIGIDGGHLIEGGLEGGVEGGGDARRVAPIQVAGGDAFACALMSDGTVWCWGADDYQQLGHLTITGDQFCNVQPPDAATVSNICNPTPTRVKNLSGVTQIALGADFACALLGDQTVWCWGNNGDDQLGGSDASFYPQCPRDFFDGGSANWSPCSPEPAKVMGIPKATSIVAGGTHACAVAAAGVYCWGSDRDDLLGADAGPMQHGGPVLVRGVPPLDKLSSPLGNDYNDYTCGIDGQGAVKCWGNQPQLNMNQCNTNDPCTVPVKGATSVFAASGYACAVGKGESLTCWGQNEDTFVVPGGGDQGPDTSQYGAYMRNTISGAVAQTFDSRYSHVLVVDQRGTLWGWGDNTLGELGPVPAKSAAACPNSGMSKTSCVALPVTIPLPGDTGVKLISAALGFSLAVTSDGTVWAWGANDEGQLGHVSKTGAPCPTANRDSPPCDPTPMRVVIPVP